MLACAGIWSEAEAQDFNLRFLGAAAEQSDVQKALELALYSQEVLPVRQLVGQSVCIWRDPETPRLVEGWQERLEKLGAAPRVMPRQDLLPAFEKGICDVAVLIEAPRGDRAESAPELERQQTAPEPQPEFRPPARLELLDLPEVVREPAPRVELSGVVETNRPMRGLWVDGRPVDVPRAGGAFTAVVEMPPPGERRTIIVEAANDARGTAREITLIRPALPPAQLSFEGLPKEIRRDADEITITGRIETNRPISGFWRNGTPLPIGPGGGEFALRAIMPAPGERRVLTFEVENVEGRRAQHAVELIRPERAAPPDEEGPEIRFDRARIESAAREEAVAGIVTDPGGVRSLSVAGRPVDIPPEGGRFSTTVPMPEPFGRSTIVVRAVDGANNATERSVDLVRLPPCGPDEFVSREEVRRIQRLLVARGYAPGPDDGVLGPNTCGAIEGFAADSGLRGWTWQDLLEALAPPESPAPADESPAEPPLEAPSEPPEPLPAEPQPAPPQPERPVARPTAVPAPAQPERPAAPAAALPAPAMPAETPAAVPAEESAEPVPPWWWLAGGGLLVLVLLLAVRRKPWRKPPPAVRIEGCRDRDFGAWVDRPPAIGLSLRASSGMAKGELSVEPILEAEEAKRWRS